eukprot:3706771-Amphidinium_carterae.1
MSLCSVYLLFSSKVCGCARSSSVVMQRSTGSHHQAIEILIEGFKQFNLIKNLQVWCNWDIRSRSIRKRDICESQTQCQQVTLKCRRA